MMGLWEGVDRNISIRKRGPLTSQTHEVFGLKYKVLSGDAELLDVGYCPQLISFYYLPLPETKAIWFDISLQCIFQGCIMHELCLLILKIVSAVYHIAQTCRFEHLCTQAFTHISVILKITISFQVIFIQISENKPQQVQLDFCAGQGKKSFGFLQVSISRYMLQIRISCIDISIKRTTGTTIPRHEGSGPPAHSLKGLGKSMPTTGIPSWSIIYSSLSVMKYQLI